MDFSFPNTEVELTINGVDCTLDVGDAAMQDRLLEAAALAQSFDPADGNANVRASEQMRGIISAILGEETSARIYEGAGPNIYKDVELVLFLRRVMDESEPTKRFDATMAALPVVLGMDD